MLAVEQGRISAGCTSVSIVPPYSVDARLPHRDEPPAHPPADHAWHNNERLDLSEFGAVTGVRLPTLRPHPTSESAATLPEREGAHQPEVAPSSLRSGTWAISMP